MNCWAKGKVGLTTTYTFGRRKCFKGMVFKGLRLEEDAVGGQNHSLLAKLTCLRPSGRSERADVLSNCFALGRLHFLENQGCCHF